MSAKELSEWKLFMQFEPFGQLGSEIRAAGIKSIIVDAFTAKDKKQQRSILDFMSNIDYGQGIDSDKSKMIKVVDHGTGQETYKRTLTKQQSGEEIKANLFGMFAGAVQKYRQEKTING